MTGTISIHALREEGDGEVEDTPWMPVKFLSTPSARRATSVCKFGRATGKEISIHALREEGDEVTIPMNGNAPVFLSTPSARRATRNQRATGKRLAYFYPRPPRGGRHFEDETGSFRNCISIHALREEGDLQAAGRNNLWQQNFYPRPPRGGRPLRGLCAAQHISISIHALREEGDGAAAKKAAAPCDFYPRPPRGGRQQKQRENPLLLSHYTPPCTNCKEVPVKQTAKSHRYLRKRLVFRCEASGKTMCAACSHWRGIKRSAHYPAQTPGAAQHARP